METCLSNLDYSSFIPTWYYFIYLQLSIIPSATNLAKHFDSAQVFFPFRPSDRRQQYASFFEQRTEATRKTDGKISFFHCLVMEMDAQ